jgi:two-component system, sporulation sensor kinase E
MKHGFLDKLIERLDRLDPESLQRHFLSLVQDRGLLETIFQSIQEGVVVIDDQGRMTYANRAAEQMLGFSLEQLRGRPAEKALRDLDWNTILNPAGAADWSKLTTGEMEVTYPAHRFVSFYAVPLAEENEDARGAVIILRDVTREREKEADLLETERIDAVKLLAAGVAHEIGNPLNALTIHLQLLEREIRGLDGDTATGLKELVDVASAEVSRLDLIITQFLKAIRPSAPQTKPENMQTLLQETLSLMQEEIENCDIEVKMDFPATVPNINVDRDQMKQVIYNVVKNAVQAATGQGLLHITLSLSDNYLNIEFRDNGKGINPDDLGRIFEPYHTTKSSGSGLGLMIVQRIIQDHGGQIDVESKLNEGTRITLRLPLADRRVRLLHQSTADARPGEDVFAARPATPPVDGDNESL